MDSTLTIDFAGVRTPIGCEDVHNVLGIAPVDENHHDYTG